MKTKDLFRMEYAQILIYIVFLGLLEVLLFIFEVNYFLMIYLLLIGLILEGVYLCQRYMKKYRYYKKVKAKLDILEQKCMITEMLELPDFAEGEFLYEILQTCNKSMNDEILKYKIEAAGYREYIEMWIHEVKTPLAATRLILENHPSEITRAMDEEMQQINYYLEQALYYARSNSVEKDYLVKELSLKEVVENAVKANAKSLIGNKIKIKIENLDQKIFSDEKWVLFILNQVISNAIKYKKEEYKLFDLSIAGFVEVAVVWFSFVVCVADKVSVYFHSVVNNKVDVESSFDSFMRHTPFRHHDSFRIFLVEPA